METLTNEELCVLAQSGDTQAGNRLIENNLPFVQQAANKLACSYQQEQLTSCGVTADDLVQAGAIALWRASDSYDPASGNQFLTYAAPAIRRTMLDLIEQYSRDTVWKLRTDRSHPQQIVYLDKPLEDGESGESVESLVASPYAKTPEQILIERETMAELHEAMGTLTERQNQYIRYRFGFEDDARPLTETAKHFHLSTSRAKGLEQDTLKQLRHELLVTIPERAAAKAGGWMAKV